MVLRPFLEKIPLQLWETRNAHLVFHVYSMEAQCHHNPDPVCKCSRKHTTTFSIGSVAVPHAVAVQTHCMRCIGQLCNQLVAAWLQWQTMPTFPQVAAGDLAVALGPHWQA